MKRLVNENGYTRYQFKLLYKSINFDEFNEFERAKIYLNKEKIEYIPHFIKCDNCFCVNLIFKTHDKFSISEFDAVVENKPIYEDSTNLFEMIYPKDIPEIHNELKKLSGVKFKNIGDQYRIGVLLVPNDADELIEQIEKILNEYWK